MRKEKMYKFYCEVPQSMIRTVWEVMEGVGENCKLVAMTEENTHQPVIASKTHHTRNVYQTSTHNIERESWRWASKLWPVFEPVFKEANGGPIRYNDPRISEAVTKVGYSPHLSPIWTALVRTGKVVRVGKGLYALPGMEMKTNGFQHQMTTCGQA